MFMRDARDVICAKIIDGDRERRAVAREGSALESSIRELIALPRPRSNRNTSRGGLMTVGRSDPSREPHPQTGPRTVTPQSILIRERAATQTLLEAAKHCQKLVRPMAFPGVARPSPPPSGAPPAAAGPEQGPPPAACWPSPAPRHGLLRSLEFSPPFTPHTCDFSPHGRPRTCHRPVTQDAGRSLGA